MYPLNVKAVKENWDRIERITVTVINPETEQTLIEKNIPAKEVFAYETLSKCFDEKISFGDEKVPKWNLIDPRILSFNQIKTKIEELLENLKQEEKESLNSYLINKEVNAMYEEIKLNNEDYEDCDFDCESCCDYEECASYRAKKNYREFLENQEYQLENLFENLDSARLYRLWYVQPDLFWGYNPKDRNYTPENAIIRIEYC